MSDSKTKAKPAKPKDNIPVLKSTETKPTPRTGRGGTHNFPNSRKQPETPEEKALCSRFLSEILVEYRQPRVKDDEELMQRFDEYFQRCVTEHRIPTVEEMYLATGYSIDYICEICNGRKNGFSTKTAHIIKKAKDILRSYDAKAVLAGEINFLAYCFRAKNYYGMVDKQEHVITPNARDDGDYNAEDIAKKYLADGAENYVDTTLAEN
jgi:hypothetical protein